MKSIVAAFTRGLCGFRVRGVCGCYWPAFYILLLLIPTGILYFRYGHGYDSVLFLLFGGAGGLVDIGSCLGG